MEKSPGKRPAHRPLCAALALAGACNAPLAANQGLEEIVVTASATAQNIVTAPATVKVVSAEDIMQLPIKNTVDVLKTLPGITNFSTAGGREQIIMHGLDEDYLLRLVDGKRVSSSNALWRAPAFDYTSIPLAAIERIEVVYGPMSALYGSDAIGGVINTITKRPGEEWISSINLESSFMQDGEGGDSYRASLYTNGKLTDNLGLVLSLEKQDQDAWRDEDLGTDFDAIEPQEGDKVYSTLVWDISDRQRLEIDVGHDDVDIPEHSSDGFSESGHAIDRWSYGLTHYGNWSWGRTEVLLSRSDADIYDYNTRYALQPPLGRNMEEVGTTARASAFFDAGSRHHLTAGAEYLDTEVTDPVQYAGSSDSLSLTSVFAQDEIALTDKLTATLGVRVEDAETYGTHTSPRAYLVYQLNDNLTLKGGVGSAFRAPTLFETSDSFFTVSCGGGCNLVGNPDLEEETSISKEIALLAYYDNWNAAVTVYHNDVEDMINVSGGIQLPDGSWIDRYYENLDEAVLQGVDLSGSVFLGERLTLDANYSYLDTEVNNEEPLTYRPEHTANLKLHWQMTERVSSYVQASYYGDYVHATWTTPYTEFSGFTTVDLGAYLQVTQGLTLRAGVTNLTDEQPREEDAASYLYLKGQSAFLGLQYDF